MMTSLNRRIFLLGTGAAYAFKRARGQSVRRVAVVGAGAFGGWTALNLQQQGAKVILIDAYGPGNVRSASGGEARLVRARHTDRIYLRLVLRAFDLWKDWEKRWDEQFLVPTGYLALLDPGALPPWIADARVLSDEYGVRTEILTRTEVTRRYPQINTEDVGSAYLEPGGATARPRDACVRVARALGDAGGDFLHAWAEPGASAVRRLSTVRLSNGSSLSAETFVFACGPWLAKVFPDAMGKKLKTPRREEFFIGPPARDQRFAHPAFPAWADGTKLGRQESYYGFPDFDGCGFRITPTNDVNELDPDLDERVVSAFQLRRVQRYLAQRFPALGGQPLVGSRVCQVEYTPDMNFIVDRHPDFDNVWIVGGGSGHGFKHGPAIGEFAAKRILDQPADPEWTHTFAWKAANFSK